ncbi:hypothetical protein GGI12_003261 [Dipsacomyces acuminosporus]|nr:hypothetical protein GGI12_003261 [Dipsacomyces acuminosporus]
MKTFAAAAALVSLVAAADQSQASATSTAAASAAAPAAPTHPSVSIPSQTLNAVQAAVLATLSAEQAQLNGFHSNHVVQDKASHAAALYSESVAAHKLIPGHSEDLGALDSEHHSSNEHSVHEQSKGNGASSVAGSMLAVAIMVGAAMF